MPAWQRNLCTVSLRNGENKQEWLKHSKYSFHSMHCLSWGVYTWACLLRNSSEYPSPHSISYPKLMWQCSKQRAKLLFCNQNCSASFIIMQLPLSYCSDAQIQRLWWFQYKLYTSYVEWLRFMHAPYIVMTYKHIPQTLRVYARSAARTFWIRDFPKAFKLPVSWSIVMLSASEAHRGTTGSFQNQMEDQATTSSYQSPTQATSQVNRKRPLADVSNL